MGPLRHPSLANLRHHARVISASALLVLAWSPSLAAHPSGPVARYEVQDDGSTALHQAARDFSVEGRRGEWLSIYVPVARQAEFLGLLPAARLIEADVDATMRERAAEILAQRESLQASFAGDRYLELAEYEALFAQYQSDHPDQVEIVDLDWMVSASGKKFLILRVTNDIGKDPGDKPKIVFTGSTHGDEWISTAVQMGLLDRMLAGYGNDERMTHLIDNSVTYWIPSASPDSYHISREVEGVDPNRVYPYPGHDSDGQITIARNLMRWYEELKPVGSIDFHGVQGSILWPWGYTESPLMNQSDYDAFDTLAGAMGESSGYIHGPASTTIYLAPGITMDAWYNLYGTLAMSIEIGANTKMPPESEISQHVEANADAIWQYIEHFIVPDDSTDDDTSSDEDSSQTTSNDDETSTTSDNEDDDTSSNDDDDDDDNDDATTSSGEDSSDADESDNEASSSASDENDDDDDADDDDDNDDNDDGKEQEGDAGGCTLTSTTSIPALGLMIAWLLRGRSRRRSQ